MSIACLAIGAVLAIRHNGHNSSLTVAVGFVLRQCSSLTKLCPEVMSACSACLIIRSRPPGALVKKILKDFGIQPACVDRTSLVVVCVGRRQRGVIEKVARDTYTARLKGCDSRGGTMPELVRIDRLP